MHDIVTEALKVAVEKEACITRLDIHFIYSQHQLYADLWLDNGEEYCIQHKAMKRPERSKED